MVIIKCKMCGGDLNLVEGQSVCECEYCGSRQTVPNQDNEKKLQQFERADWLRRNCEFDRAAAMYESIVAEFREESEAYWGLVLCKYGIEYVDDPGTGKKIPTCHRSSFDSVMEDPNLEMAMDYADSVARRVYREEAKQIEEIRKGIIAVSANEQPYDIFICYKETDEKGDRTLDSVLAQDIYDALNEKGYRVFFARITLEDKLGVEYEPYIFAALNSAKIMLAVGTDYEYYNAVWVKNEWSRFLKLMAQDKTRHLIPCYKNIDAYDMPKEFAKLQAQDLGKVGAMQDLMRGIEKILPRQKNTTVIQERVVVGGGAGNRVASLLDRGNMALEDGDWAKADSFFEDVLNNDSKNAEAYLGKVLAQEKCRTLDALIRKRKEAHPRAQSEKRNIPVRDAHIREMVEKYTVPGYVDGETIRRLYTFDLSYTSEAAGWQKQYADEKSWWENHKQLSRAEKFAAGAVAENLQAMKQQLFSWLSDRVEKAKQADAQAEAKLEEAYTGHIAGADSAAEHLYSEGAKRREEAYEENLRIAKSSEDPQVLGECGKFFWSLGQFRDSEALAEHCRKRAEEIREELRKKELAEKARLAEEEERRIIAQRKAEREAAAKKKKITILLSSVATVVLAVILLVTMVIIPGNKYKAAQALLSEGKKAEAAYAFSALGDFRDSKALADELWQQLTQRDFFSVQYTYAVAIQENGKVLNTGGGYKNYTEDWPNVIALDAETTYALGLKADGTVVAGGTNPYDLAEVSEYVKDWEDIVAITAGGYFVAGLKNDGTVVAAGTESKCVDAVRSWNNIIAISAGAHQIVGLKADGTVVAAGKNEYGECNVSGWTDIVAITTGNYHTVGLKADGTVVAAGRNKDGECNVSGWTDIISISADYHTVGLRVDGTVVATGENEDNQCDVQDLKNVIAVWAGYNETVYMLEGGGLGYVGPSKQNFQLENILDWTGLPKPELSEEQQAAQREQEAAQEAQRLAEAYSKAESLAAQGKTAEAALAFYDLGNYQDSRERCTELWAEGAYRDTISAGWYNTTGLKADGTVVDAGDRFGKGNVTNWTNIVAVDAGMCHTVGLKADGTVVAVGSNYEGQCDVAGWKDIVAISASQVYTMGLKIDGTVVFAGVNVSGACNVEEWTDIVAISAGSAHTAGLKSDGTVVAVGDNEYGQCDISDWSDIVAIAAGQNFHTVGLKADGTVVAVGLKDYGQCDVESWTDVVAIAAGGHHTVGLKADGTVVAVGHNYYGQCDVDGWSDIVAIAAGNGWTVGLKADGTVVAVGNNQNGQCDVAGWTGIKIPD